MAKVLLISLHAGRKPQDLRREKAEIEADLKSDDAAGERAHLLTSQMVRYQGKPAIYQVRIVRGRDQTTRVQSLIFNEGADQYQVTVYAHSLSPGVLRVADQGWQELTKGLHRRA